MHVVVVVGGCRLDALVCCTTPAFHLNMGNTTTAYNCSYHLVEEHDGVVWYGGTHLRIWTIFNNNNSNNKNEIKLQLQFSISVGTRCKNYWRNVENEQIKKGVVNKPNASKSFFSSIFFVVFVDLDRNEWLLTYCWFVLFLADWLTVWLFS